MYKRQYQYFKRLIGGELSLIGLWRRGLKFRFRLSNEIFKVGDVLLIANRGEKRNISDKLELAGLMHCGKESLILLEAQIRFY